MIPTVNGSIVTAQRILECAVKDAEMASAIRERDPALLAATTRFDRSNILRTNLIMVAWRKIGRQVLAMHPEVVEEVRVATSDKVPAEILRVLPYINPMVVYSDPPQFGTWVHHSENVPQFINGEDERRGEHTMHLLGFYCAGSNKVGGMDPKTGKIYAEQRIYPTTDLDAKQMVMVLVFEVHDASGKVVDYESNTMTIDYDFVGNFGELVEDMVSRFHWASTGVSEAADRHHRKWTRQVMSVVIGSLFYLCSTTLEAEEVPKKQVDKKMPKRLARAPLSLYKVGWTTGAALTRIRTERTYSTSQQTDLGHQQDPQHRRAHFKMQPYGPGQTLRKLIFVSAYWTHLERLGEEGVNTARPVPRVNGKGSARESMQTALGTGILPAEVN